MLFQVGFVCSLLPVNFLTAKVETGDVPSTSKGKGKMKQSWRPVIARPFMFKTLFKDCNDVILIYFRMNECL